MAPSHTAETRPEGTRRTVRILNVHGTRIPQERRSITNPAGSHQMVKEKRLRTDPASCERQGKRTLSKARLHARLGNEAATAEEIEHTESRLASTSSSIATCWVRN